MVTRATSHRFRLTLGLKIGLGFAMGAAVTVGVGLVGIFGIATISATMDKTSVANQAFVAMNDVHQTFSDFLAAKTDRTADATSAKIGSVIEAIHRIDTGGANFKTAQSALNDLKIEIAAMLKSETDIRSALALNDASSAEITAAIAAIVNRANGQSVEAATLEQATMARLTLIDTVLQQIDQLHTSALKSSGFIQKYAATGDDSALQSLVVSDGALDQILAAIEGAPLDPVIAKNAIQVAKSLKIALTDAGALNGLYQTAHAAGASDADRAAFAEATDALVTRFDGVVTRTEGMRLATGNVRKETLDGMLQASKKRSAAKDMAVLGQTTADARSDLLFAMKDYLAKAGRGDDAGVEAQITRLADLAARTDTSGATNGLADAVLRYRTSFAAARDVLHRQDDIRKRAETAANTAVRTISDIAAAILSETNETTSFQRMLALATLIFGCLVTFVFAYLTARSIRTPITALTRIMARLAEGDTSVTAPETGRSDEIGEMSRTVSVFRDAAIEKRRLEADAGSEAAQRAERQLRIDAMIAEFRADIERLLAGVSEHARKMESAARRLNDASGQSQRQVLSASGATSEATENVSTVAASAEELAASIDEISQRVKKTVEIVGLASDQAQLSNERITGLAQSATRIGDVVKLIRSIAEQTNLLALNATIEAARAGDAGRGFAVVAAEVKQLADQTAKATQDIAAQVDGIQLATRSAVDSIGEITRSMQAVNTYTTSIALAVAEQGSATSEISRNAQGASQGTQIVAQSMDTLVRTASETTDAATDVNVVAREVIDANRTLTKTIDSFLETVAAA